MQSKKRIHYPEIRCERIRALKGSTNEIAIYIEDIKQEDKDRIIRFAKSNMPKCRQIDVYVGSTLAKTFLQGSDYRTWVELDPGPNHSLRNQILRKLRGRVWRESLLQRACFAWSDDFKAVIQHLVSAHVVMRDWYWKSNGKFSSLVRLASKYFRN